MKTEIKKLFYYPLILIFLLSFGYFFILFVFMKENLNEYEKKIQNIILNEKKRQIKNDIKHFKVQFKLLQNSAYELSNEELNELINIFIKNHFNKFFYNDTILSGLINNNIKLKYSIYKNKFIIAEYYNKKYLSVLKNYKKNIYILGIRKKFLDTLILSQIIKYLDKINKNNPSYIALGKITTFHPKKDGVFGYLFYMPSKLRYLEGLDLSTKKPDFRGNLFRQKYFNCLKNGHGCFVTYYWKNPLTGKIEPKLSYFDLLKEYNLSIVKGFYKSQYLNDLNLQIYKYKKEISKFFILSIVAYIIIFVFIVLLEISSLRKIRDSLYKEYEKMKNDLLQNVYYDSLTNLPNRNKLLKDIYFFTSLILIDIEDFSDINDVFGFETGDKILKDFSKYLTKKFSNVYRIGSDEFAILRTKNTSIEELKNLINEKYKYENINISLIIGASNYKQRLLETAEMALKIAQKEKRQKFILYDKKIFEKQKEKLKKINLLKNVLEKENIIPYYQCIVDSKGNIVKYEALMRINMDGEIQSPFFFMDLIKEARLYNDFSKIMIKKVLRDIDKINKKVSINLSFDDLVSEEMREFILNSINEQNGKKIVFEILESESVLNYELVKEFINNVKNKNVEIAIDDFGSGYSNFVRVLSLNPDIIKIDASLIKNLEDIKNKKMIELIIEFAKYFKLKTVAEFVSDKEKFDILNNLGINEFQGYYFCEPQPLENIIKKDKI